MDLNVGNLNISAVPVEIKGGYVLFPIVAGVSALALSLSQNRANILQSESSNANKYGTMVFSVGLSLYLGFFVQVAIAIYWIFNSGFTILQNLLVRRGKKDDKKA